MQASRVEHPLEDPLRRSIAGSSTAEPSTYVEDPPLEDPLLEDLVQMYPPEGTP